VKSDGLVVLVAVCASFAPGCASSSGGQGAGGGSCAAYVVPSSTDLSTPATTFAADVMPILKSNCANSTNCHGSATGTNNGVTLGKVGGTADPHAIRANLVGIASKEDPSMSFVAAGDPGHSFLMHKMDGDQCTVDSQCTGAPPGLPAPSPPSCQNSMPSGSPLLDVSARDTVRRWIQQGAKDD
jgi:hypothetical protein